MQLTQEFIDEVRKVAKEYDAEKEDMQRRKELGKKLDDMTSQLSDGQLRQMSSIISR